MRFSLMAIRCQHRFNFPDFPFQKISGLMYKTQFYPVFVSVAFSFHYDHIG
ncbi:hypothetical protein CHISP_3703 [Chitinispirillum alkaliphilum]|nr:hypothetical protein CHISP_3703 [Chitinispirillum alkaliphilum]